MTNIHFIHTGCDTVPALSGIGKTKLINSAIQSEEKICSTGKRKNNIKDMLCTGSVRPGRERTI